MYCVVDVLGFKQSSEEFVLKEFAMVTIDVKTMKHLEFVVKPPYPFDSLLKEYQDINSSLTRNLHGISWDSGTIPYEEARPYIRKLLKTARIIYVRGSEKKVWLRSLLDFSVQVVDLKKFECPSARKLKELLNHTSAFDQYAMDFASAGENVKLFKLWMLQNDVVSQTKEETLSGCLFLM
uniref:AsIV-cont00031-ORF1 n=1 Tax=Apophua simplicipes ichnovirus TaxID=1329648 RepID=S5DMI2_9VIRU|nr:AsIV-cont00031-ORF1 [Apophua simplicipes ichnovirus]